MIFAGSVTVDRNYERRVQQYSQQIVEKSRECECEAYGKSPFRESEIAE